MAANHKTGRDHTAINIRDDRKNCKKCIFRVPNVLRRQNPEAYTPDVVSIGPFHHCPETRAKEKGKGVKEGLREKDFQLIKQVKQTYLNEILAGMNITTLEGLTAEVKEGLREKDFQLIEQVKQTYLNEILAGMNITTLEGLTAEVIKLSDQKSEGGFEQRAREFYAESFNHIPSKDFTEMMIVDGCFLLQLFRKFNHPNLRAFDDLVFNMDCMFHFLCHDILLLENQLPWFVIHSLYNLTDKLYPSKDSLSTLILEAFSILPSLKQSCSSYKNHLHKDKLHFEGGFLHILDLLRSSIVIPLRTIEERELKAAGKEGISNGPAEEHQVRCESSKDKRDDKDVHGAIFDPDLHQIRTATDLSKADIKFESVTRESIMVIQFEKGRFCRNGVLKIPKLNIGMSSETLFRNFIAIEQCYHDYRNEITSYAILMDNLISSQDDMELLRKKKVIGNWMSDEDGCKFFSNLYKDIPHNKFYYVDLCKQVNDCYSSKWYTWLALLKSEKFSNPWRILAFGIGIFILILTAWSQSNNIRVNMHKW